MKVNLEALWDENKVCRNPHKGWYFHYFDNGIENYQNRLASGDYLLDFPGLNHIYLRLAWSFLEPHEGEFNWTLLDDVIERWRAHGYTVAFRVTCKETGLTFATPRWVMEAGAQGTLLPGLQNNEVWEPDYGDAIFLTKLEAFHRAFAARYDHQSWVEYVDIGSYGDWGEGHTASSSLKDWPLDVIKRHIDIHCACYTHSILMISDDIVGSRKVEDGSREELFYYLIDQGVTLRDDGVSVKYFAEQFGKSTLRSPEMFEPFWRTKPIDLELQHYHMTLEEGTWQEGRPFEAAMEEAHATFAGFHGDARQWLADNPALAQRMANRLGYWYFLKSVEFPSHIIPGRPFTLGLVWENRGVAPAYHRYGLHLKWVNCADEAINFAHELKEVDNRNWLPHQMNWEQVQVQLPEELPTGEYRLGVALLQVTKVGKIAKVGKAARVGDEGTRVLQLGHAAHVTAPDEYDYVAVIPIG